MRIVSFLFLLYFSAIALLITILNNSILSSQQLTNGPNPPFIPAFICITNLIFAIYSIFKSKDANPPPLKRPIFIRWFLLAGGLFILFCGFTMFSVSLFSPFIYGSDRPVPEIGVILHLIMIFILSVILYFAYNMNTPERPNLFRYLAMVVAFLGVNLTTVLCLMLLYAVPVQPPTPFPFLSGLLTIAFLPISLLILIISKSQVTGRKETGEI